MNQNLVWLVCDNRDKSENIFYIFIEEITRAAHLRNLLLGDTLLCLMTIFRSHFLFFNEYKVPLS